MTTTTTKDDDDDYFAERRPPRSPVDRPYIDCTPQEYLIPSNNNNYYITTTITTNDSSGNGTLTNGNAAHNSGPTATTEAPLGAFYVQNKEYKETQKLQCVKNLQLSGYNPPPGYRKLKGEGFLF